MMMESVPETSESTSTAMARATCQRVLLVEDDRRLREMLEANIIEMGLQPTTAPTAEAGLKLLATMEFGIAVVDLNLPGMSGLDFAKHLFDNKTGIQTIILTGFGDVEAAQQAIRMEAVDFLLKPCGMDDLERALSRARLRWLDRWFARYEHTDAPPMASASSTVSDETSIEGMERRLILTALARHNGNRQATATELGISVRKLYYRLQQYQTEGLPAAK